MKYTLPVRTIKQVDSIALTELVKDFLVKNNVSIRDLSSLAGITTGTLSESINNSDWSDWNGVKVIDGMNSYRKKRK